MRCRSARGSVLRHRDRPGLRLRSATATWSGNTVTISGGMAAHARPFVVGQAVNCAGCNSNLVITSLSVPPTQSTVSGAGEVGQTFTFTANNAAGQAIGGSGSGAVTGGCSGTSGNRVELHRHSDLDSTSAEPLGLRRRSTLAARTTSTATRRTMSSPAASVRAMGSAN